MSVVPLVQSTLLQCLIGELRPVEGSVEVCGRVSYASQQPWIYSGTVKDNVLFGLPFRRDWYNTVVQACCLDKVFVNVYMFRHLHARTNLCAIVVLYSS